MTYRSIFDFIQQHNRRRFLRMNHPPKVIDGIWQRTLCGDEVVSVQVALKYGKKRLVKLAIESKTKQ